MKILQFPLTKITIAFVLGILSFPFINIDPSISFCITSLGFTLLLLLYFFRKNNQAFNNIYGLLILVNSFFIGINTVSINKQTFYKNHYSHYINETNNNFEGAILIKEKLKNTQKNYRYVAEIKSIKNRFFSSFHIILLSRIKSPKKGRFLAIKDSSFTK